MACEVCQHCDTSITPDVCVIHNGLSYHKQCRHCYVCGETDLHNGETFRGVIFCAACSKRIFQGCSTARQAKSSKRRRSPKRRRRHDRVLEITMYASGSETSEKKSCTSFKTLGKETYLAGLGLQKPDNNKEIEIKKDSAVRGTSTYVTQETLKCIKDNVDQTILPAPVKPRKKRKTHIQNQHKIKCSDLRIAELGASVEIAHMALRKQSEVPVIIKSEPHLKRKETRSLTTLKQESDLTSDSSKWRQSLYSTEGDTVRTPWTQRRFGSILKIPLRSFKRNILDRSSLVSVRLSNETYNSLREKLKRSIDEEIVEHHRNGLKKLYSTINRRNRPCKLGWTSHGSKCNRSRRCKHFEASHSYRCMRNQVMRLAGPTRSELAVIRGKILKAVSPNLIKNILNYNKKYAAILSTQAYRR